MSSNVKVVCRFRPINKIEQEKGSETVISIDGTQTCVKLKSQDLAKGPEADGFTFDRVFGTQSKQVEVFEYGVKGIVDDVINGYNGTVFAYGQTGSGKTYTMMGADIDDDALKGLIPRITEQIFNSILSSPANLEYLVKVSYFEVYMERIRDLLAPQNDNLQIHEEKQRGVYIKNLSDFYVADAAEVYDIMRQGGQARAVSSTNMNSESSRSHSIFVVTISQRNTETGTQKNGNLYLVDLAGSEKIGKTGASGQTLEEAKKINKSLSALGMVINALTDGKSTHIPYRDSKLTRILQESLGGNSRTTLIINCSPSIYNEAETLGTLRFGMRAKTIKNKARVNAELSPAELKALLKKAQADVAKHAQYINMLEGELAAWRQGNKVDQSEWVALHKVTTSTVPEDSLSPSGAVSPSSRNSPSLPSRPFTPVNPAIDTLRDTPSRPDTPSTNAMDKDEREEFLRRENELSDQLAEKEALLSASEKLTEQFRDQVQFFKEQEATASEDNKSMNVQLNELRLQIERLSFESREANIGLDSAREQNNEMTAEIEELRKTINELKLSQRGISQEGKDKKKAEKMAALMGNFDAGGTAEKEEQIRSTLRKLDEALDSSAALSSDDIAALKQQLYENQTLVADQQERLRVQTDEVDGLTRRRDELESRLAALEQDYDDLLNRNLPDEQAINDIAGESAQDLRNKLEAQYAAKRDASLAEVSQLKQQLDVKLQENKNLSYTVDALKGSNEELKRAFAVTSASVDGGKNLVESAKDLERIRRTMAAQLADFDTMKKALMKDLQDRCEKVVELEITLDETQEQYNTIVKSTNLKAQQRKMEFLTRNLDQLTSVQRQLVDQNMALKKDISLAERKLQARNERIINLEALLHDSQERLDAQNAKYHHQMDEIRRRLEQAHAAQQKPAGNTFFGNRLAKPLRGQGAAPVVDFSSTNATPISVKGAQAPAKEGKSSWFYT